MCVRTSVVLFTPSIDVFLSLNGTVIHNNGLVNINDIGSTDDTALLCITNRPPSGGGTNSGGNWHAPDWTRVGGTDVPGFDRNRGPIVVRLLRRESETPTEGIYHCAIEDNTLKLEAVNVGLYNSGGGNNRNDLQFFLSMQSIHYFLAFSLSTCTPTHHQLCLDSSPEMIPYTAADLGG